jgi:SAM-dependent methyltransferase
MPRSTKTHPIFAALFDRGSRFAESRGVADLRRGVLSTAKGRVIEIGAGTGLNFAHYPPAVTEVVAVEPDPAMLRRAAGTARRAPLRVRLRRGSAERLPFADDEFDTAVATLVLCSVADPALALQELRRVVRPGGRLLFLEHVRSEDRRLARWQDRLEGPWGFFGGGCHPNRDTVAAISAAGFEVGEMERFPFSPSLVLDRPHASGVAVNPPTGA